MEKDLQGRKGRKEGRNALLVREARAREYMLDRRHTTRCLCSLYSLERAPVSREVLLCSGLGL